MGCHGDLRQFATGLKTMSALEVVVVLIQPFTLQHYIADLLHCRVLNLYKTS